MESNYNDMNIIEAFAGCFGGLKYDLKIIEQENYYYFIYLNIL